MEMLRLKLIPRASKLRMYNAVIRKCGKMERNIELFLKSSSSLSYLRRIEEYLDHYSSSDIRPQTLRDTNSCS